MFSKYIIALIVLGNSMGVKARESISKCPRIMTPQQINELQKTHQVTSDGTVFIVDGSSLLLLPHLKAEDFTNGEPFVQQHGRTLNCWLRLKGYNKYFGLRQK